MRATRTCFFLPVAGSITDAPPTRVGFPLFGSTTMTFETCIGASFWTIPPCGFRCDGFVCRFIIFTPSTMRRFFPGNSFNTLPVFPRLLPEITITVSFFRTFINSPLHSHRTSGANETIFMYCFSRSSRATGPKIRVPRGSP